MEIEIKYLQPLIYNHALAWLAQACSGILVLLFLFYPIDWGYNNHDILFIFLDMQQPEIQSEHLFGQKDVHSPMGKRNKQTGTELC